MCTKNRQLSAIKRLQVAQKMSTSIQVKNFNIKKEAEQVGQVPFTAEILAALPVAVIAFNDTLDIVYANDSATMLWGKKKNLREIFSDTHTLFETVQKCVQTAQSFTLHDAQVTVEKSGHVHFAPIQNAYILCVTIQNENIRPDPYEKMQSAMRPAQMMARMLAHEIKNPLAGIRAAAQILLKTENTVKARELLTLIASETERINRLTDKTDIFADVGACALLNLHAITAHAANHIKATFPAITLEEFYDPSLPAITGHADSLTQAVLNMVCNAADAGASRITIRSRFDVAAPYHATLQCKLPVVLEIEDNGTGIAADILPHVFEPCYTTKPQGQGLGLAIVAKIAADHNGVAEAQSDKGKTVLRLRFPVGTEDFS